MRRDLVFDLDLKILDHTLFIYPFWKDTRIIADIICLMDTWPQVRSTFCQIIHIFLRHTVISKICYHICVRADDHISVCGICHMNSHIGVAWNRINRHRKKRSGALIQDNIISLGTDDAVAGDPQHIRDLAAAKACAVYYPAGLKVSLGCGYFISIIIFSPDCSHFTAKMILHTVCMGIFCQGNGIAKGIYDTAVMGKHGKFSYYCRNQLMKAFFIDQLQVSSSVVFSLLHGTL